MPKKWYRSKVIRGQGKGRKIGYPTANLQKLKGFEYHYGIYTTRVRYCGQNLEGILYWGTKGGTAESLEIHLFDFSKDIYDCDLDFTVGEFLREDRTFSSDESLAKQIAADVTSALASRCKIR